jgi:hypothetical protein
MSIIAQGLGQELMARAGTEAIIHGCKYADVDIPDFQAPKFYRWLGYTVWGVLDNLTPGHRRIILPKSLAWKQLINLPEKYS